MKILSQVIKFVVGAIFIFSGLVKLNDPVGTQIKLEEYFEVFATDMPIMHDFWMALVPYTLYFSVIFCASEIILGVALLVNWRPKLISWLLLLLIIFFSFLTFYSAYFNKVTDCGCFGDFMKLKPWTSFTKDIVLLVLIIFLLWQGRYFTKQKSGWFVGLTSVFCLGLAFYAIRYLPPVDFLPYKVGAHIPTQMQPSEPLVYNYIMEKDGSEQTLDKYPTDTTYKFKEMILVNENAKPKITDYKVWNNDGDYTQETFKGNKLFIIVKNTPDLNSASLSDIRALSNSLKDAGVEVMILTSESEDRVKQLIQAHQLNVPYYFADATVLKTIMRSNPGLWLMKDGTVKGKWHYNTCPTKEEVTKSL